MKKKAAAMALSLLLAASSLAACGNAGSQGETTAAQQTQAQQTQAQETQKEQGQTQEAQVSENGEIPWDAFAGTELTVAYRKALADMSSEDLSEKPIVKMAEEATGIKVNWVPVDVATQNEKVSTMLASDLPDIMIGLIDEGQIAKNMELFYDLSEDGLMETYAPHVWADYQTVDGLWEAMTWKDGSVRSLAGALPYRWTGMTSDGIVFINQEWLDRLGLDMPTNGEELYHVLCAFRDEDANGNGDPSDEIPFGFCEGQATGTSRITTMGDYFGLGAESTEILAFARKVENGKVIPTFETDKMRTFLEYMHRLKEDGLLDVEGFSQTTEQWQAKLQDGRVGVFSDWSPDGLIADKELVKQYTLLEPFGAVDGVEYVQNGKYKALTALLTNTVISAKTEHVEAALHWWDYLSSSTELKIMFGYGPAQVLTETENGIMSQMDPSLVPENMTSGEWRATSSFGQIFPLLRPDENPINPEVLDGIPTRFYYELRLADYLSRDYMPVRVSDPDVVSDRGFLEVELKPYLEEFLATAVMDGITDASWEAHLERLKSVGYYEWIQWYQDFYDGVI